MKDVRVVRDKLLDGEVVPVDDEEPEMQPLKRPEVPILVLREDEVMMQHPEEEKIEETKLSSRPGTPFERLEKEARNSPAGPPSGSSVRSAHSAGPQ